MKIETPTLLIDKSKVESNIQSMLNKIDSNTIFRPHFKTHQSAIIGEIFKEKGVDKITVSSVSMAQYFSGNGWNDITIAFPVNLLEVDSINELAKKVKLNILVESSFSAEFLHKNIYESIGVIIKIDTGYNRTGLIENDPKIDSILEIISPNNKLTFKGFLTHAGNTYDAVGRIEILAILEESRSKLSNLKQKYISRFPNIIISYGDTPSCSICDNFDGFDEIRPGNFVYYDVMQYHIGSCSLSNIAVAVACPIVSTHKSRSEIVIYGGAVHFSKEYIAADNEFRLFGYIVRVNENGWGNPISGAYLKSISQEHGIIKVPDDIFNEFLPGDIIGILPIHSCLTADLLRKSSLIIN